MNNANSNNEPRDWVFIVRNPKHLIDLKTGDKSWWCADRRCKVGDRAFIYRPLKGIAMLVKIVGYAPSKPYCISFGMNTAAIEVLRIIDPSITARALKTAAGTRNANFVCRNFQGTSFLIESAAITKAILALA